MVIYFLKSRFELLKSNGVDPIFVKMDKDIGQIRAAQEVWPQACINICLWHILKAIKRRINDPKELKPLDLTR
jgi:hypothetical protein